MLFDWDVTVGRTAVAWQGKQRPHITDSTPLTCTSMHRHRNTHLTNMYTQPTWSATPLEVSPHDWGIALWSRLDGQLISHDPTPGRGRGWRREDVRTGPLSAVLVSLTELHFYRATFQVLETRWGGVKSNGSVENSQKGFTDRFSLVKNFLFKAKPSIAKKKKVGDRFQRATSVCFIHKAIILH